MTSDLYHVGSDKQLFIDDAFFETSRNIALKPENGRIFSRVVVPMDRYVSADAGKDH